MKKIISLFILLACVIGLSSCKMKECRCYSTNVIFNDSIVKQTIDTVDNEAMYDSLRHMKDNGILSITIDTVDNFTHGDCEEFNKNEVLQLHSVFFVHHSIKCREN